MISIKENNDKITMIDVRSNVKQELDIEELVETIKKLTQHTTEELFGTETEEKTETSEVKKSLMDEQETECAPAQQEDTAPIMNPQAPDINVGNTDLEKTRDVEEAADEESQEVAAEMVEESQEAEVKEVVEEVKEVVKEGQETADDESQEAAAEIVEEDQEAAVEEAVEGSHEAAVTEEIKDPSWYGMRWSKMLDAFEELNVFFRAYRKRDMESQIIPKAKLRMIHDYAVNMAAEIEKAIGAGYGK